MTAIAKDALLAIKGDFQAMLLDVIKEPAAAGEEARPADGPGHRQAHGRARRRSSAEMALDIGLHSGASDAAGKGVLRDIRFQAAAALGARKWAHAIGLLIEHLDMTIGEFDKGLVDRNHLLDAIGDLGATNTHDAAVRLTQFLVLINSYTEKGKAYDDQVVFAVLQNLGALGDKVAFDDLMYTQYLNYSTAVKKAARAALDNLKW